MIHDLAHRLISCPICGYPATDWYIDDFGGRSYVCNTCAHRTPEMAKSWKRITSTREHGKVHAPTCRSLRDSRPTDMGIGCDCGVEQC